MANKYPQYTISQWIDTTEESMNKPQATILFGVRIKPEKGAIWMHCCRDNEPLIFDSLEKASAAIDELKAASIPNKEERGSVNPVCTAFVEVGQSIPQPRCTNTMELF